MERETGRVIVIGGPTGSGESTITKALVERLPAVRMITATTRPPRSGERDGIDYFFFPKEEFLAMIDRGEILEHTYIANRDTYYGTYGPELTRLLSAGRLVLANTDIVGARFFKERFGALTMFIAPESLDSVRARLLRRNPDISAEELSSRIDNADHEINEEQPFYDVTITNREGRLESAIEEAEQAIRGYLAAGADRKSGQ